MPDERKQSATFDVKLRIDEPLHADIVAAARGKGSSMNAEMRGRLQRPIEFQEFFRCLLGGPQTAEILITLAMFARPDRAAPDDAWLSDASGFNYVMAKWREYLAKIPAPSMSAEEEKQVENLESLIRLLDEHPAPIKQSQPQVLLRAADFMFSQMHLDPERAAKIARDLARVRSQITAAKASEE
jgi:hypothetical protein